MQNKKILFACGGTMGHINPALAVSKKISKNNEVYFISTTKELENNTYDNFKECMIKEIFYYPIFGFNRHKIFKNIKYIISNLKSYQKIKQKLKELQIDVVISMGGGCGTICALAAKSLRIKTIVHEQNKILGLGNKICASKVDKVLLSYPLKNKDYKVIGNPVESEYYERYGKLMNSGEVILVFGGSNGAEKINDFIINNSKKFLQYKIILITGKKYYEKNSTKIEAISNPDFLIIPYTNNMIKYYRKAKIVICRAGATTIAEIMALGLISICIPSPNVTANHQYFNALHYHELGCLEILEEKDLKIQSFFSILERLLNNDTRQKMKQNININHNIYSSYLFVEEINNLIGEYNE